MMFLNYSDAVKYINNGNYKNINLINGDEPFLIDKLIENIIEFNINESTKDFNLDIIESEKDIYDKLHSSCETLPFFGKYRIVILNDMDLSKTGISGHANDIEKLIKYFDNISESTLLFFVMRSGKAFKGKFYKKIQKIGNIIDVEKLNFIELKKYIESEFKANNLLVKDNVLKFIIERTGYLDKNIDKTLYDINNELKKIMDISKGDNEVSIEKVNDVLANSFENNIFKLTDALGRRDIGNIMKTQKSLIAGGMDPFMIFYMIIRQIRNLLFVKELKRRNYTINDGRKKAKISRYEYEKLLNYIRFWTYKDLRRNLHLCYEIETTFKSKPYNQEIVLDLFFHELVKKA